MNNQGLIFIPDISGFTRFVNEVEIDHGRRIIEELLEVIINSNSIGLEISEIEGDAILFYKYGEAPDIKQLYDQVEKMFCAFHKHLIAYDHRRFCQCKACSDAIDLTLKVVTHYGEFTGYTVKNFNKLIGKDIIIAHQLLKNDIDKHEYWLVTNGIAGDTKPIGLPEKLYWNKSLKHTEAGEIPFQYTQLSHLKDELPPEPETHFEIKDRVKVGSVSRVYNTDIINLLHCAVDFETRHLWQEAVKAVEDVSDPGLMRLGTRHRCLFEKGSRVLYSSSYSYSPYRIEYSETDDKKKIAAYFTFENVEENKNKLSIDLYIKKNLFMQLLFKIGGTKKLEKMFNRSLERLEKLVERKNE